ncbi:hypothetical protein J3U21_05085 [Gilliamella sp. B2776]|nr:MULTISPECIES: hypothetical protein [unclassified Gilliamella]MCX8649746.1 hypothetical protein [Gilliamella sp. B2779]MCX8653743.1 hypothetical protein [Gilliamella sp. B2737]MCX8656066.1 hypothetical protein [Gilliamella sp. B2894]MCX8664626.1 hypothetical protein [Gilliamella sp. B2887]MCX8691519.1 hypothetical protein [Gilliamella sp. B2776]
MAASICAPYFSDLIADKTVSLNSGFYLAAVITMVGITAMLFVKEGPTVY